MNLLDLAVKIGIDDQASGAIGGIANGIKSTLGTAAKVGAASMAAITGATVAVGGAFVAATGEVAAYGDSIDKMSQKMGMSAEAYQEWNAVMQHSGTSMETMKASMKTLANAAETGNEAFQRIGITQEQIASMSQEELFEATIAGLQNVESETERTYLAGQLMGRGATELGALLNTSAEETQAMRDRVHELGGVMSDDAVKAAAAYQDSLQDMQTALDGLKHNMMSEFLPSVTEVMDGLQEIFIGNYDEGAEKVGAALEAIVEKAMEIIPKAAETAGNIGMTLMTTVGNSLLSNLPKLFSTATTMVLGFVQAAIAALPQVVSVGTNVITTVVNGIASALPSLIPAATSMVTEIASVLIEATPQLLEAGVALLQGVADGIMNSLDVLAESGPKIIEQLRSFLESDAPNIMEAGFSILENLINGLMENLPMLTDMAFELIETFASFLLENAPTILQSGVQLVIALVNGLVEALPTLLGYLPEIISGMTSTFSELVPEIIEAGFQLLTALVEDLPAIIEAIVAALPDIITSLIEFFISEAGTIADAGLELLSHLIDLIAEVGTTIYNAMPEIVEQAKEGILSVKDWMASAGKDLLQGVIDGLTAKAGAVYDKAKSIASSMWEKFKSALEIGSPSKLFRRGGVFVMQGLALGLEDEADSVVDTMAAAARRIYGAASGEVSFGASGYRLPTIDGGGVMLVNGLTLNYLPGSAISEHVQAILLEAEAEIRMGVA